MLMSLGTFHGEELRELVDVSSSKPKTDEKSREKISEKKVKNKIVINPPQGMTGPLRKWVVKSLKWLRLKRVISLRMCLPLRMPNLLRRPTLKI